MPEGSILDQLEQERSEARERLTQASDSLHQAYREAGIKLQDARDRLDEAEAEYKRVEVFYLYSRGL